MFKEAIYLGGISFFELNAEYQVGKMIPLIFIYIRAFFDYQRIQVQMFLDILWQGLFKKIPGIILAADDISKKFSVGRAFLS